MEQNNGADLFAVINLVGEALAIVRDTRECEPTGDNPLDQAIANLDQAMPLLWQAFGDDPPDPSLPSDDPTEGRHDV